MKKLKSKREYPLCSWSEKRAVYPPPNSALKRETIMPNDSSIVAIETIFRGLAVKLDAHRKRLLENPDDPEALHKFRVSIRKIKSIIDAFKAFLSPDWHALHRRNLSHLMAETNEKRDRDVLLTKMPFYRSLLPKKMQKGLTPLQKLLLKKKEISDRVVLSLVENELLRQEIASLPKPEMKSSLTKEVTNQPIVITAMQIVEKRASTIVKKGKRLDAQSGEEEYHKLRIQYKKIRYTLEVMQPLIEREKYDEIMRLTKKMQTILGDFHDYQVQKTLLLSLGSDPLLQKRKTKKVIALLIVEIDKLEEEQEELFRKNFIKMKRYKKRAKRLFGVHSN
ncbi:MAG: CHAD domain-containing protein [Campylobacterota bacterium]|nr:CHAD domain-containing protein [Campylobacterota bacterium]